MNLWSRIPLVLRSRVSIATYIQSNSLRTIAKPTSTSSPSATICTTFHSLSKSCQLNFDPRQQRQQNPSALTICQTRSLETTPAGGSHKAARTRNDSAVANSETATHSSNPEDVDEKLDYGEEHKGNNRQMKLNEILFEIDEFRRKGSTPTAQHYSKLIKAYGVIRNPKQAFNVFHSIESDNLVPIDSTLVSAVLHALLINKEGGPAKYIALRFLHVLDHSEPFVQRLLDKLLNLLGQHYDVAGMDEVFAKFKELATASEAGVAAAEASEEQKAKTKPQLRVSTLNVLLKHHVTRLKILSAKSPDASSEITAESNTIVDLWHLMVEHSIEPDFTTYEVLQNLCWHSEPTADDAANYDNDNNSNNNEETVSTQRPAAAETTATTTTLSSAPTSTRATTTTTTTDDLTAGGTAFPLGDEILQRLEESELERNGLKHTAMSLNLRLIRLLVRDDLSAAKAQFEMMRHSNKDKLNKCSYYIMMRGMLEFIKRDFFHKSIKATNSGEQQQQDSLYYHPDEALDPIDQDIYAGRVNTLFLEMKSKFPECITSPDPRPYAIVLEAYAKQFGRFDPSLEGKIFTSPTSGRVNPWARHAMGTLTQMQKHKVDVRLIELHVFAGLLTAFCNIGYIAGAAKVYFEFFRGPKAAYPPTHIALLFLKTIHKRALKLQAKAAAGGAQPFDRDQYNSLIMKVFEDTRQHIFDRSRKQRLNPTTNPLLLRAYNIVIQHFAFSGDFHTVKDVLDTMVKTDQLVPDSTTLNMVLVAVAKSINNAHQSVVAPTTTTTETTATSTTKTETETQTSLTAAVKEIDSVVALVLQQMQQLGISKHALTYNTLVEIYCNRNQLDRALELIETAKDFKPNRHTLHHLVLYEARNNRPDHAMRRVREFRERGVLLNFETYNPLLALLGRHGMTTEAEEVFAEFLARKLAPTHATYFALIDAYTRRAAAFGANSISAQERSKILARCDELVAQMRDKRIEPSQQIYDMITKISL